MNYPTPTRSPDTLLLQQVEQGNKQAFNLLFKKYWEKAYSQTYKKIKTCDAAKDIVQEIFTHIWINRETIHIENLSPYLNVAIRNRVIKFFAEKKPIDASVSMLDYIPEKNARADGHLLWKEFYQSYEALLQSLPPQRQIIFRLHYQEDVPTKDIGTQLGIARKTVQNQLRKAVNTLRISVLSIS